MTIPRHSFSYYYYPTNIIFWLGIISGAILQLQVVFQLNCSDREIIVGIMLAGAVGGSIIGGKKFRNSLNEYTRICKFTQTGLVVILLCLLRSPHDKCHQLFIFIFNGIHS